MRDIFGFLLACGKVGWWEKKERGEGRFGRGEELIVL